MSRSLDIGCGDVPRNPFLADECFGVDVRDNLEGTIKCADLALDPIPFPDAHFDYVTAHDFLEHVPRIIYVSDGSGRRPARRNAFIELMNEVHRVLKPGGLFLSITPAYPHGVAFRDPTHVNFITEETFTLYFDDTSRWASIYGFTGAFRINVQRCEGMQIKAILQKVELPKEDMAISTKKTRISIIIPIYNGEKFLRTTLESILAQTYKDFEILCVDDGSTDTSEQILNDFACLDARIRVYKNLRNLGSVSKVINHSLQYATGDFFVYSSQDDLFSEDWLEKMHQRWLQTGADAVIPEVVMFHEHEPQKDRSMVGLNGDLGVQLSGREAMEQTLGWRIPGNALWNIGLIRKLGLEEFAVNADEYSVRKLFLHCNKVVFSEGTYYYRQDNGEAITKKKSPHSFDWPYTQLRIAQLLQEYSFPKDRVELEIRGAISGMAKLRHWLDSHRQWFTPKEHDLIASKIERFEERLKFQYPFSILPRNRVGIRGAFARLARSLRKRFPGLPTGQDGQG